MDPTLTHDPGDRGEAKPGDTSGFPAIDGFEFIKPIGRGGMGVVWLATQLTTKRRVALKLLAGHQLDSDGAARFRREIELASQLEHPGIARVYDSGVSRGQHFYCMEYIEGLPLNRFADQNKLSRTERIELMRRVCDAVQFAHLNGVIHRDLKPSNILVTPDGQPHVLDFGLAKLVNPADPTEQLSMAGEIMGTPIFMSPEQARGEGQIDTRTDVYSLGVMLFELVTGLYPQDVSGTNFEIMKRVIDLDPKSPREIDQTVDRDLEAMLLKALSRKKESRYESAGAFAGDLVKYLQGDPLSARRATTLYFISRRFRKYRGRATLALLIIMGLISMAIFSYVSIANERDRANAEAARADVQAANAIDERQKAQENFRLARNAVQDFFVTVGDKELDNIVGVNNLRTVLLMNAYEYYEKFVVGTEYDKELNIERQQIMLALAAQHMSSGHHPKAREILAQVIDEQEYLLNKYPGHIDTMRSLMRSFVDYARYMPDGDKEQQAELFYTKAKALAQALQDTSPHDAFTANDVAYVYDHIAKYYHRQGKLGDSALNFKSQIDVLDRFYQSNTNDIAARMRLAYALYAEAMRHPPEGPVTDRIASWRRFANLLTPVIDYRWADIEVLKMLGIGLGKLGEELIVNGEIDAGREESRRGLALLERLVQLTPDNESNLNALAIKYSIEGKHYQKHNLVVDSTFYYEKSVPILERLARDFRNNSLYATSLIMNYNNLATLYEKQEKNDLAVDVRKKSAQLNAQRYAAIKDESSPIPENHIRALSAAVEDLIRDGNDQEAMDLNSAALLQAERYAQERNVSVGLLIRMGIMMDQQASLLMNANNVEEALVYSENALGIQRRIVKEDPELMRHQHFLASGLEKHAQRLSHGGRLLDATLINKEAVAIREQLHQSNERDTRYIYALEKSLQVLIERLLLAELHSDATIYQTRLTALKKKTNTTVDLSEVESESVTDIDWRDSVALIAAIGKLIRIGDVVANVNSSRSGSVIFVNFSDVRRGHLTIIFAKSDYDRLSAEYGADLGDALVGKKVFFSGLLTEYNGNPQMVIRHLNQINYAPES